jgi:predicted DNA-binding WGR domain protein
MTGIYYLEFHDAANNSHKFYAGNPRTGWVLYGRVGAKGTLKHYDFNRVNMLEYEKRNKGYNSAPTPQYVLDTLNATVVPNNMQKPLDEGDGSFKELKKVKPMRVKANQGLFNWFSSLSDRD